MLPKTIESYGAPWNDAEAATNPETEQAAAQANRMAEDLAQCTRTVPRAWIAFATTVDPPGPITLTDATSVWGDSIATSPTIAKTATGTYTATYATSYDDALVGTDSDEVSETEQVNFRFGWGSGSGGTFAHVQVSIASNVVTIYVFDDAAALSDLGGGVSLNVFLR
jgi:hypothetical protein